MLVDAGCLNVLTREELDRADKETFKGLSGRANAIGIDKFCIESKAQYFGMYEDIKSRYAVPVKQSAPQPTQKSENAVNAYRVMTKNEYGYNVNACAEAYYLNLGIAELAKRNVQLKALLGGVTPEELIASQDTRIKYAVIYGLMSDTTREAKKSSSIQFVTAASTAIQMNKYSEFIKKSNADIERYSNICNPIMDQMHSK